MVRLSKQKRKRKISPRKPKYALPTKVKEPIPSHYKVHQNAVQGELQSRAFIPTIKAIHK